MFGVPGEPFELAGDANTLAKNLARSPVALQEVPDPRPLHDDWVITRPRLTGICGSDSKQILLDFGEGDADNALAAFCSFPRSRGRTAGGAGPAAESCVPTGELQLPTSRARQFSDRGALMPRRNERRPPRDVSELWPSATQILRSNA